MKDTSTARAQHGFTLIELVVVIAVLAILAATALPRFVDLSTKARIAKMQAAEGAVKTGMSIFHAAWLANNSPANVAGAGTVALEGTNVPYMFGYPDVGGDGTTQVVTGTNASGVIIAAGGLTDYSLAGTTTVATSTIISIIPDTAHPDCELIYTEAAGVNLTPTIDNSKVIPANC